jgi:hypothetical protein
LLLLFQRLWEYLSLSIFKRISQVQILARIRIKDAAGGPSKFKPLAGLRALIWEQWAVMDAYRSDLYPNILQSTPFLMDVMNMKVYASKYKRTMVMLKFMEENANQALTTRLLQSDEKKR